MVTERLRSPGHRDARVGPCVCSRAQERGDGPATRGQSWPLGLSVPVEPVLTGPESRRRTEAGPPQAWGPLPLPPSDGSSRFRHTGGNLRTNARSQSATSQLHQNVLTCSQRSQARAVLPVGGHRGWAGDLGDGGRFLWPPGEAPLLGHHRVYPGSTFPICPTVPSGGEAGGRGPVSLRNDIASPYRTP